MLELNDRTICPYCGYVDTLYNFFIKKKDKSLSLKMVKCPMCENKMKKATLVNKMSFYEWGLWLYLNIIVYKNERNSFYDKLNFKNIYNSLYRLGGNAKDEFKAGFNFGKEIYRNDGKESVIVELEDMNIKHGIVKERTIRVKLTDFT